tara:strand:+ start:13966 stop:14214 length:249 start_codon:yes stop_codon:yes gene_type:complete
MYTFLKVHDNRFKMIQNDSQTVIIEGTWNHILGFLEFQGFQDLELALEIMEKNGHNAADFGMNRSFIFSFDNKQIPKLRLVS